MSQEEFHAFLFRESRIFRADISIRDFYRVGVHKNTTLKDLLVQIDRFKKKI